MRASSLILLCPLALGSCGLLETAQSPEGQEIAKEIGKAATEAAANVATGNWTAALTSAGAVGAGVVAFIRLWRGGVHSRKGEAPAPAK